MFGAHKLTRRVEKLEDAVSTLRHELQSATLDYLDIYAKAKKLYGRVAKAQEREDAKQNGGVDPSEGVQTAFPGMSSLSERGRKIQQQILDRRAAAKVNGG